MQVNTITMLMSVSGNITQTQQRHLHLDGVMVSILLIGIFRALNHRR
jgi:hypothetical protein